MMPAAVQGSISAPPIRCLEQEAVAVQVPVGREGAAAEEERKDFNVVGKQNFIVTINVFKSVSRYVSKQVWR